MAIYTVEFTPSVRFLLCLLTSELVMVNTCHADPIVRRSEAQCLDLATGRVTPDAIVR